MTIDELTVPAELDAWDDFVLRHPAGVHPQLSWWIHQQDVPLLRTTLLAARDDESIVGGVALYHMEAPLLGCGVTIAPQGPIVEHGRTDAAAALARAAITAADRRRALLIQFEAFEPDVEAAVWSAAGDHRTEPRPIWKLYHPGLWRETRVMLHGRTPDDLLASFAGDTRQRVRQATKRGYQAVTITDEPRLRQAYDIWKQHAADNGYTPRAVGNFLRLAQTGIARNQLWCHLCEFEGKTLGFCMNIRTGRGAFALVLAHIRTPDSGPVPRFLYWSGILDAQRMGLDYYSFGAPMRGSNTDFKQSFAPVTVDNRRFLSVVLRPGLVNLARGFIENSRWMNTGKRIAARLMR